MKILKSQLKPLPQSEADDLSNFLAGDTCHLLRAVVKSRMSEELIAVGETTSDNAEAFMRAGAITDQASESMLKISQYSIFLKVLDEVHQSLKQKSNLVVIENITIDQH